MTYEIETKVLDIDAAAMQKRLIALGATKTRDTRLTVDWYHIPGTKESEEPWFLRIRSNSEGTHEVTWKARSDIIGVSRKHKEINFFIDEPEKLADLFNELGLEQYAHQEKDRTSYSFKDWLVDIDCYPGMPAFMEIEGNSEQHVQEAMRFLGVADNRTWADGERTLIQKEYGLDWYALRF